MPDGPPAALPIWKMIMKLSKPSETTAGKSWVLNFGQSDRETAALLIDSLEIHDQADIASQLKQSLEQRLMAAPAIFPAVLIAVKSLEDLEPADRHIAYKTFFPGDGFSALPGSEAEMGGLSRGLVEKYPDKFLSPELTLPELKDKKVRSFYLLSDYSGSGTQLERFVDTFLANPTILSWISLKRVRIEALVYASSLQAEERLRNKKHVDFQRVDWAKGFDSTNWSDAQRQRIRDLCYKYAESALEQPALGYADSAGLYLSNSRVPNNLPQILIRGEGSFLGLFPNREVTPGFFEELRSYRPNFRLAEALRNLGETVLADKLELSRHPGRGLRTLAFLRLYASDVDPTSIESMLGLKQEEVPELISTLNALELLDAQNKITLKGDLALQSVSLRRRRDQSPYGEDLSVVDYIPTQLR
ncbi:MAG: phosphoribosyltransferase-like protein [Rhodoglobus sp.]